MTPSNSHSPKPGRAYKGRLYSVTETTAESTTVVLAPWKSHENLLRSVDALYSTGGPRFRLIVVEADASDTIRLQLEHRARLYGNIKTIFTNRRLSLGEAWNLALPHIRTTHALFTTSHVAVDRQTLGVLTSAVPAHDMTILCPNGHASLHGFFATAAALKRLQFFDENIVSEAGFERFLKGAAEAGITVVHGGDAAVRPLNRGGVPLEPKMAVPARLYSLGGYAEGLSSASYFVKLLSKSFGKSLIKQAKRV